MSVSTLVRFQSKGHIPWSFLTFYLLRALLLQLILLVSVVTYPHNCISLLIHYGPGYRSLRFLIYVPEAIEDNLFSRVTRRAPLRFLVLEIYRRWKVVLRLRGEESSRTDLAPRERCCLVKHVEPNMFGPSLFGNDPMTLSASAAMFKTDTGSVNVVRDICSPMLATQTLYGIFVGVLDDSPVRLSRSSTRPETQRCPYDALLCLTIQPVCI